ncbi:MAG: hypothetical protein NTW85_16255 [Methylococcales bacterium]|nr:hypothetical protein [Methylococcales bacterium]
MKYIQLFFASSMVLYLSCFSAVLLLIDAPIPADYWVKDRNRSYALTDAIKYEHPLTKKIARL